MARKSETTVRVGQVWTDNDKRQRGRRTLRVVTLQSCAGVEDRAVCEVLQDGKPAGRTTTIRLDRFHATSTGYLLVSEATA